MDDEWSIEFVLLRVLSSPDLGSEVVFWFCCSRSCPLTSSNFRFDQWVFERMTKDTTLTAPSTMKIMVVAPPIGNIFTVGAKRFRCAEVLATQVSPSQLYSRFLCCCVTATLMSLSVCQDALARVSALSCY